MTVLNELRAKLVQYGYEPISSLTGRNDRWYRRTGIDPDIEHFLFLGYKPVAEAYSVHAGVVSVTAGDLLRRALPTIRPFLSPTLQEYGAFLDRPCWALFDAGRALGWRSTYVIPDPRARDEWQGLLEQLFTGFLEPLFLPIADARGVREVLSRQDPPFEWMVTPGVLRAAEVIALGFVAGVHIDEIRSHVMSYRDGIERHMAKGKSLVELIDSLMQVFGNTTEHAHLSENVGRS